MSNKTFANLFDVFCLESRKIKLKMNSTHFKKNTFVYKGNKIIKLEKAMAKGILKTTRRE
ncbi:hypothetical protein HMPREF3187_00389 [Aerococcus christensenii]|uniref:Uncharacterized protein n=1 Tax=Aerococcus christensenii TaxID=87541 RepID=A0A133Y3P9_9LACT|nr:hypothetical protein HMPREF3187_00389 [Aerococcus christensenii]